MSVTGSRAGLLTYLLVLQAIEREEAMKKSTRREKQRQSEAKAAAENEPLPTPQPTISTTSAKEGKSSGFGNFF